MCSSPQFPLKIAFPSLFKRFQALPLFMLHASLSLVSCLFHLQSQNTQSQLQWEESSRFPSHNDRRATVPVIVSRSIQQQIKLKRSQKDGTTILEYTPTPVLKIEGIQSIDPKKICCPSNRHISLKISILRKHINPFTQCRLFLLIQTEGSDRWGELNKEPSDCSCRFYHYIIFVRSMGQENTKPEIIPKYPSTGHSSILTSARKTPLPLLKPQKRVECEGLLTLRTTPFKNCIQIQTECQLLFIQNIETTMKMLLQSRLHTNRLFMSDDIQRLIEAVTFTLAFLQEKQITYRDISSQSIFYDKGNFKLLPNQLVQNSTYQRLKQGDEVLPSPQLIIALRCGEDDVTDEDILQKSNVFTLGMTLLEVCTLLPSLECYDQENYDILDSVINQRIVLVEEYYGEKISRILANMLDYDYTERMNLKEMSIWINRQLLSSKNSEPSNDPMTISMTASQLEKTAENKPNFTQNTSMVNPLDKSKSRLTKNNSVYMGLNRENENVREDRNKIYINDSSRPEFNMQRGGCAYQDPHSYKRQDPSYERLSRVQQKRQYYNAPFIENDSFKFVEPQKQELRHPNPYCDDFSKFTQKKDDFDKYIEKAERDITKRMNKQPLKGYNNRNYMPESGQESLQQQLFQPSSRKQKGVLKQIGNQYYPNIQDIFKNKPSQSNINDAKSSGGDNGALSRIKEEILKSRKLIEEFKKNEGLKF